MVDAFLAFVRNEDKLLLLRRSSHIVDYPSLWDGVFGIGDSEDPDVVLDRVTEVTGLPRDGLEAIRDGPARGFDAEVTPWLIKTSDWDVTPSTLYDEFLWVDPGHWADTENEGEKAREVNTSFGTDENPKMLKEMYGDVASFLFIIKTTINQEEKVADEMRARLSGTGSLKRIQSEVYSILHPHQMRGYLFVEASAIHHVEELIGRGGGITTPLKNARTVLGGETPLRDVLPYMEPKSATSGIDVGCIVEIVSGAFKNEKARVTSVSDTKEEVTMVLHEAMIPMELTTRADQVRVIERVDGE